MCLHLYSDVLVKLAMPSRGEPSGRVFTSALMHAFSPSWLQKRQPVSLQLRENELKSGETRVTFRSGGSSWLCSEGSR